MLLSGEGLFSGAPVRLRLAAAAAAAPDAVAPTRLAGVAVSELALVGTARTTTVRAAGRTIALVEHLFAALGSHGLHCGVAIDLEPDDATELPLLDGGARAFCDALLTLGSALPPSSPPPLVVARAGEVAIGASRYAFEPPAHRDAGHGDGGRARVETRVEIELAWEPARDDLATRAAWDGDRRDFVDRIAPARTFATARDVDAMLAAGVVTRGARSDAVVLVDAAMATGDGGFARDEPARHKLLDLVGDLYLYGGPPHGVVRAFRPGHANTHAAVAEAFACGLLVRRSMNGS